MGAVRFTTLSRTNIFFISLIVYVRKSSSVMLKHFFLFGLLSTSISNITAFRQPDPPTNEHEPANWTPSSVLRNDGSTVYYAISDLPMTYEEAYEYCNTEKGYLAEPRSPEETVEINKLVDGRSAWIGLTDLGTETDFVWMSDGQNTESYDNWDAGEPSGDGDCVELQYDDHEEWNDLSCDSITGGMGEPIYALCQRIA